METPISLHIGWCSYWKTLWSGEGATGLCSSWSPGGRSIRAADELMNGVFLAMFDDWKVTVDSPT